MGCRIRMNNEDRREPIRRIRENSLRTLKNSREFYLSSLFTHSPTHHTHPPRVLSVSIVVSRLSISPNLYQCSSSKSSKSTPSTPPSSPSSTKSSSICNTSSQVHNAVPPTKAFKTKAVPWMVTITAAVDFHSAAQTIRSSKSWSVE